MFKKHIIIHMIYIVAASLLTVCLSNTLFSSRLYEAIPSEKCSVLW